jgi:predicted chitinase
MNSVLFALKLIACVGILLCAASLNEAKATKPAGLAAAVKSYLKPAAMAAEKKIQDCTGKGDLDKSTGECSTVLQTILRDGTFSSLKQQLSLTHSKGMAKTYLLDYAEQFKSSLGLTAAELKKFKQGLQAAVTGKAPVFLRTLKCDKAGKCKYLLFTTAPYKKNAVELFILKSAMSFAVAPDIVIVRQTVTDPETGLSAGDKIVMKEVPRAKEQAVDDVMTFFDKYVYEEMLKALGPSRGNGNNGDPAPPVQENPFFDSNEAATLDDADDEFHKQFKKIVNHAFNRCVQKCLFVFGDAKACQFKCKMDGKEMIEESKRHASQLVNQMVDKEETFDESMMDSSSGGKVQGIQRYSPNRQREQSLIDACYNAGLRGAEARQFMAQCSHECDNFNTMEEYASGAAYEGRSDLGNNQPGDGRRFKGRGYIQLTGRANYITVGNAIGVNLVSYPDRAKEPAIAAKVALHFWKTRVRRRVSNFCDTYAVTRVINGGTNGLSDRKSKFAKYGGCSSSGSSTSGGGSSTKSSCATCLNGGGGKGCASRCPSNFACQNCVKYGGGRGCLTNSKCGTCAGTCFDRNTGSCSSNIQFGKCPGGNSIVCCPGSLNSGSMFDSMDEEDAVDTSRNVKRKRDLREALNPSSGKWKYDPVGGGSTLRDMILNL